MSWNSWKFVFFWTIFWDNYSYTQLFSSMVRSQPTTQLSVWNGMQWWRTVSAEITERDVWRFRRVGRQWSVPQKFWVKATQNKGNFNGQLFFTVVGNWTCSALIDRLTQIDSVTNYWGTIIISTLEWLLFSISIKQLPVLLLFISFLVHFCTLDCKPYFHFQFDKKRINNFSSGKARTQLVSTSWQLLWILQKK